MVTLWLVRENPSTEGVRVVLLNLLVTFRSPPHIATPVSPWRARYRQMYKHHATYIHIASIILYSATGPRGYPPAVAVPMEHEPPPDYSVAAHLPSYEQSELSKGNITMWIIYFVQLFLLDKSACSACSASLDAQNCVNISPTFDLFLPMGISKSPMKMYLHCGVNNSVE